MKLLAEADYDALVADRAELQRVRREAEQLLFQLQHPVAAGLIQRVTQRPPDFVIGGEARPYLLRWWVIARNRLLNVYLHCFKRSDDDRAHHSHPWLFRLSIVLRGEYTEHRIVDGGIVVKTVRRAGDWHFRWGASPHRIELHAGDCWTLFITGPRVRQWGFYCMERGWVHWKRFTAPNDAGSVGPGCDA